MAAAMKSFALAFAFLAITVTVFAQQLPKLRKECEIELGKTKPKCINACISKKLGLMVNGKLDQGKEIAFLQKRNPKDVTIKAKTSVCVITANADKDECEVANTSRKCLIYYGVPVD